MRKVLEMKKRVKIKRVGIESRGDWKFYRKLVGSAQGAWFLGGDHIQRVLFALPSGVVDHFSFLFFFGFSIALWWVRTFCRALSFEDGYEMYKDTKDLLHNLPPPGVEIHCLHGKQVPTTERWRCILFNIFWYKNKF